MSRGRRVAVGLAVAVAWGAVLPPWVAPALVGVGVVALVGWLRASARAERPARRPATTVGSWPQLVPDPMLQVLPERPVTATVVQVADLPRAIEAAVPCCWCDEPAGPRAEWWVEPLRPDDEPAPICLGHLAEFTAQVAAEEVVR